MGISEYGFHVAPGDSPTLHQALGHLESDVIPMPQRSLRKEGETKMAVLDKMADRLSGHAFIHFLTFDNSSQLDRPSQRALISARALFSSP
jgi:hypothetical protein